MTYYTDALTAVTMAQAEHEATVTDLYACRSENAALRARVTELEAELHPEPPTVFGMSRPDNSGVTSAALVRTYLGPGQSPSNIAANAGLRRAFAQVPPDGGAVWLSHKDMAGVWLESLLADAALRYPGVRVLVTARHEPRDMIEAGQLALYHLAQDALEAVVAIRPNATAVTVLEGFHRPSRTPGYYDELYRPAQEWGVDAYNPGIQTPTRYEDPAVIFDELLAYADAHGKRMHVGETGTGLVPGDDGSGRLAWLTAVREHLAGKAVVVSWWNAQGCTLTASEADAWL